MQGHPTLGIPPPPPNIASVKRGELFRLGGSRVERLGFRV